MQVLVTGGCGFIGAHLVAALAAAGDEVTVLDNLTRGTRAKIANALGEDDVRFVEGDIRDPETVALAIRGVQRVFHCAAQSNVLGAVSDIDYSFTTNVVGTYTVLRAAHHEQVERVVFTSSREVYGEPESLPVMEGHALNPKNTYGASKVAGEVYCRSFASTYGLDVSVLRLANVYGPGDTDRVTPIWLERARESRDLEIYGGEQVLDLVPISLVVAALVRAGETCLHGRPVNVGSGVGTTLLDLAARVQRLPGARVKVRLLPARRIEVVRFVADVSRMKSLLGLTPPDDPLCELASLWRTGDSSRSRAAVAIPSERR